MRASSWQSILSLLSWPSYTHKVLGVPRKDLEKCLIPREKRQQSLHEGRKALHCLGIHLGSIWPFSILSTHAPLPHMPYTGSDSPCKRGLRVPDFQPPGDLSQNLLRTLLYGHQLQPLSIGTTACSSSWPAHSNRLRNIDQIELMKTAAKQFKDKPSLIALLEAAGVSGVPHHLPLCHQIFVSCQLLIPQQRQLLTSAPRQGVLKGLVHLRSTCQAGKVSSGLEHE